MKKIEVKNLTKIFGDQEAYALTLLDKKHSKADILKETGMTVGVNQATFTVRTGEVFVIMGLSGSGKSTLIRLVNRLIEPTSGEVLIDGENLIEMDERKLIETRRKKLGMVFQNFGLLPHRTVLSNVAYGLEIQGISQDEREAKALKVIEDVGLKGYENSFPKELSGGMQQRVGIARALTNDSDILLMDEAFSALDPIIRKEMQDELINIQKKLGKTILFITHDLDEALKLGDRIAIMNDGKIIQIGQPEEILENPVDEYVSQFVQDVDRSKVLSASHIMKPPQHTLLPDDTISIAIQKMEEYDQQYMFVTNRENQYEGIVLLKSAKQAQKEQARVESILLTEDVYVVSPTALLSEIIVFASSSTYPIVVTENGNLLGEISFKSILSGLALGKDVDQDEVILK